MTPLTIILLCIACWVQTSLGMCPCMKGLMGVDLSSLSKSGSSAAASSFASATGGNPIAITNSLASNSASIGNAVINAPNYGNSGIRNIGLQGNLRPVLNGAGNIGFGYPGLNAAGNINALGGAVSADGRLGLSPSRLYGGGDLNVLGLDLRGAGALTL